MQHEEVERLRSLGNPKEKLEDQFDKGGSKLDKDDWFEVDYASIVDWKEQMKLKRDISFESEKVRTVVLDGDEKQVLDVWKRPKSITAAGRRNWSFVIFHPNYQEGQKIEITLPFDRHTQTKFLNSTSKKIAVNEVVQSLQHLNLDRKGRRLKELFISMKIQRVESIRLVL